MTSPHPLTQSQRPRPPSTPNLQPTQTQADMQTSSFFETSTQQKDKMVAVTGRQQLVPGPVYQEFTGPSTNFIFSQPGSYHITMGQGPPPAYQQEYPYAVLARPPSKR